MLDLLVIGAGLTGLTAAFIAAQAGQRVRVVATGMGSLHWTPGTLDVLGYLPDNTPVDAPLAAVERLPADHPLRQVGAPATQSALADLVAQLDDVGLVYAGAGGDANLHLPSPIGAARPVYLAPAAQAAGRLDDPAPMLVVGFDRVRDFYPTLLADNLARQGHRARSHTLSLDLITDRYDINLVQLAQRLEAPDARAALGDALARVVSRGERIGLPAILGLDRHAEVWADLQACAGARIFEIPTLPPGVPGIRLHRGLARLLERHRVRVESNMTAVSFGAEDGRITWVATAASARPLRHAAANYLLATGGWLGGGFASDHTGRGWETIFDLPLTLPPQRADWFDPLFLSPAGQPVFHGGVPVSSGFQPCDATGEPIYANLWAAGNLLAHADGIRTRSREAIAIASATVAARDILARQPALLSA
jgi:glycerol-3-phosphate dehydrogenase subunit B